MEHLADKIQKYIEGQLHGNDLLEFENHMQQDVDFWNIVNLQKEVHKILNQSSKPICEFNSNVNVKKSRKKKLQFFLYICSLIASAVIGYLLFS